MGQWMRPWRFLLLSAFLFPIPGRAAVWETTRAWSAQAEAEFGEWIRTVPLDIFNNPRSRYDGIATDCADAAYALRIIFAWERGLPVRFQNSDEFSNRTSKFDSERDGLARLKKFIHHVRRSTSTSTLVRDTYPVEISRAFIRPGAMFLHASSGAGVPVTYRSGHVYYLRDVRENGMITYVSSTVPTMIRDLAPRMGIQFAPLERNSGYRVWAWPDSSARPGSSEMQFSLGGWRPKSYGDGQLWMNWQEAVQSRIRTRRITVEENFEAASQNLRSALVERARAVRKGWEVYQRKYRAGSCMSDKDYDDHSTPTRDVKIQSELQLFQNAARKLAGAGPRLNEIYRSFRIEVLPGVSINFLEAWEAFMTIRALEISEPEHTPLVRWGLEKQGRWPCPHRAKQYVGGDQIDPH